MALLPSTSRTSIWQQRHRILLIVLVFVVLIFLYAVQVDWVPYLNQTGTYNMHINNQKSYEKPTPSSPSPEQPHNLSESEDDMQLQGHRERNSFYSVFPQREPFEDEKFLAYFPHSGFHNQRITLENALRLAAYLNRTLLLPPLYLSKFKEGLVWKPPPVLEHQWIARNRSGVEYCRNNDPTDGRPPLTKSQISHLPADEKLRYNQCYFYHSWTVVPWTFFFDIPKVIANVVGVGGQTEPIRVFDRPNMTIPWLQEHLKIKDMEKEVFFFEDATRYHYKIMDDSAVDYSLMPEDEDQYDGKGLVKDGVWKGRYTHPLLLTNLRQHQARVLHFGSLYASDRVEATTDAHRELKKYIEDAMDLWNEDINYATNVALKRIDEWRKLTKRKAPEFLGVHLRTADGPFIESAGKSLERLRTWVRTTAQLDNNLPAPPTSASSAPTSQSSKGEKRRFHRRAPPQDTTVEDETKNEDKNDTINDKTTGNPAVPEPNAPQTHPAHAPADQTEIPKSFLERCMGAPPESPLVFMSTDIPRPRKSEMLKGFIEEFPCVTFLSDFPESLQILDKLQNPIDGIRMHKYTVAMLDANIAAMSRIFRGTEKSTFSAYIYQHLWPKYHHNQVLKEYGLEP